MSLTAQHDGVGASATRRHARRFWRRARRIPGADLWLRCLRSQLERAKISLTGGDRVRWLNGMVTNNIRDLAPGHGVYAFLLNPQGHILGDLYAYNRGESLLVDTDQSQIGEDSRSLRQVHHHG